MIKVPAQHITATFDCEECEETQDITLDQLQEFDDFPECPACSGYMRMENILQLKP